MAVVEDIISNGLRPGDRLPSEAELMERFQISRASLREGLRLLETYGVITIRQGQRGGPEIGSLSASDLARMLSLYLRLSGATYGDVFGARLLLEPVMCRIAAELQAPKHMKALRELLEFELTVPDDDYILASNRFHQLLSGLSGNPVLDQLGRAVRVFYAEHVFRGGGVPDDETVTCCREAHQRIGAAILGGEGERAQTLMAEHMSDLSRLVNRHAAWFANERVTWEV
jgi:GntR family transcriptional repressor for pyruvate dehydrogenase complex